MTEKKFTVITHKDKPFTNVRTIIEDKKGAIWLGGNDGLWRYESTSFTHFRQDFVGYIYEDKKGNIWTSSGSVSGEKDWALSRYDEKLLSSKTTPAPETIRTNEGMIFGILEAYDGKIWFGTLNGVYRYNGKTVTDFKSKEAQK